MPEPQSSIRHPAGRVVFDPRHREWLEAGGYLRPEGPLDRPERRVFFRSEHRENARVEDGPGGRVLYDKRLRVARPEALLPLPLPAHWGSLPLWEWRVLRHARDAGLRVPEPWAAGERRRGVSGREGFIVVTELPGRPLAEIASRPAADPDRARSLAHAVGTAAAQLHAAGISFPSLFAKHVWIEAGPDGPRVGFLDLADARLARRPGRGQRARDLGALAATLPRSSVSLALRRRALDAYLDAAGISWSRDRAWREISRAAARLGRKRRFRRFLATAAVRPLGVRHSDPSSRIAEAERDFLERSGGFAELARDAEAGWEIADDRITQRGASAAVGRSWQIARLLHDFAIPAPAPVAVRLGPEQGAVLLRRPEEPGLNLLDLSTRSPPPALEEEILAMLRRLLRAGLLPARGLAQDLVLTAEGRVGVSSVTALSRPPQVSRAALDRSLRRLAADLEALPLPPGAAARIMRRLRAEAAELVWLVVRPGAGRRRARRGRGPKLPSSRSRRPQKAQLPPRD